MSDFLRPHRWQPSRLRRPWDSPGKNIGVGCHFFLQCMKVKVRLNLLSCVRLFVAPWTAAHQDLPSMGFSRQEYWTGVPLPSPSGREFEQTLGDREGQGRIAFCSPWGRRFGHALETEQHQFCILLTSLQLSQGPRLRLFWLSYSLQPPLPS